MNNIETKYFNYCKSCRMLPPAPRQVPQPNINQPTFMKTNTRKAIVILSVVASGAIVMLAATKIAASYFELMAIGVSYTAVATLVALAIVDYRGNVKDYAGR